jgi:hypothetical protein
LLSLFGLFLLNGVFHQLIDSAEEEECKEAILAYYLTFPKHHCQSESLTFANKT